MKKYYFLSAMIALRVIGAPISQEVALEQATDWMKTDSIMKSVSESDLSVEVFPGGDAVYSVYVVSLSPTGYLVLNSDDRLPLVLSFSNDSSVDLTDLPDNVFRSILQGYVESIAAKIEAGEDLHVKTAPKSKAVTELYGPVLEAKWNQGFPYNLYCPTKTTGSGRAPSGCVMTAYSQVLAFHCWPPKGMGSRTYTDDDGSLHGTHSADFSDSYNWSAMRPIYNSASSTEENEAVGELMAELGVLAAANYENGSTGAFGGLLGGRLKVNLYYEPANYATYMKTPPIADLMYADLRAGFPVPVSIGGHQIVADGLKVDNGVTTCHFNYGWGGSNDGWYAQDNINGNRVGSGTTSIRPQMRVYPINATVSGQVGMLLDLGWIFPKRRQHEVAKLRIYKKSATQDWSLWVEDTQIVSSRIPAVVMIQEGQPTYHTSLVFPAAGTYQVKAKITDMQGVEHDYDEEFTLTVSASAGDADSDGMQDAWERAHGLNPNVNDAALDPDADGLTNLQESSAGTDPQDVDSDNDEMPDGWEFDNGLNPLLNDAADDPDADGLTNRREYTEGTDPQVYNDLDDTDDDGLDDTWEITHFGSITAQNGSGDADSDGVSNKLEETLGSDPNNAATPGTEYAGLHTWWKLDDASGSVAVDSSGNGNDGTVSGATWTTGIDGGALSFDGVDDWVYKMLTESRWPAFSVALWVKVTPFGQSKYSGIFNNNASSSDFQLDLDGGSPGKYRYHGVHNLSQKLGPVTTAWSHLTVSYDGTQTKVYVDGVLVVTTVGGDNRFGKVELGVNRGGSSFFGGVIDDLRVYKKALTDQEIVALYQNSMSNSAPDVQDATFAMVEDASVGATVGTVAASDPENDTLAFSITPGDFAIDPVSGEITVTGALDYETTPSYSLTVTVSDGALSDTATITINITDVTDEDADGLDDAWEITHFGSITAQNGSGDPDADGLTNLQEYTAGTDPQDADSENDGMPDGWELDNGLNPLLNDAAGDPDADGLTNLQEYTAGTDPQVYNNPGDADADGLLDTWEITHFGSITAQNGSGDPDSDGVSNEREETLGSDPNNAATPGAEYANLCGWWKFDETTGTVAADSSGNGSDADNANGVLVNQSGQLNGAFRFDGSNDSSETQGTAAPGNNLTITAWIRPSRLSGDQSIIAKNSGFTLKLNGSAIWFTTPGYLDHHGSGGIVTDVWQFVAVTFTPSATGGCRFYRNGTFQNAINSSVMDQNSNPIVFGKNEWGQYFKGGLDDIRLYDRILTAAEIDALYQNTAPNTAPSVQDATFAIAEDAAVGATVGTVAASDPESDTLAFSMSASDFAIDPVSGEITVTGALDYETTPSYSLTVTVSDGALSDTATITINITDVTDEDADGLDDAWEITHFGNRAQNASGDPDGDGYSNLEEAICGTHPTNATSLLRLEKGEGNLPSFHGVAGRKYTIRYSTNLVSQTWFTLGNSLLGTNGMMEVKNYDSSTNGFRAYRVEVEME